MRWIAWLVLPAALLSAAAGLARDADDWTAKTIVSPGPLDELRRLGNGLYLDVGRNGADGGARYHRLRLVDGAPALEALPYFLVAAEARRPDMLPDGLVFYGERNIREAWLAEPTGRYRHGVLGDALEAGTLKAVSHLGTRVSFSLPTDAVFEDLYPRLVDLDGDELDEILVVKSYRDRGAALAVFRLDGLELRPVAETPPIGLPNRWLNPVGVGDFDGDDRPEVALVVTPHIGGILRIYELADGALRLEGEASGFSNHVLGSRELQMSAVADLNRDGVPEIVLPSADRKSMRIVSYLGGNVRVTAEIALDAPVVSAIHALDLDDDGRPEISYALDDDGVVVLTR